MCELGGVLTLHRASPSTQRSISVYMTVTGRHTTHMRMSEHDRLAIRMLVTLRSSCCRAMMNTRPAFPSNPIAMIALYATIQKVAPPMEGGHWDVSAQSEPSHMPRKLLSLAMAEWGGGVRQRVRGRGWIGRKPSGCEWTSLSLKGPGKSRGDRLGGEEGLSGSLLPHRMQIWDGDRGEERLKYRCCPPFSSSPALPPD